MLRLRLVACAALLPCISAQDQTHCVVPSPPGGTVFEVCKPGSSANENAPCKISCAYGSSQGGGTYTATCKCTGVSPNKKCAWDKPFRASCTTCPKGTYNDKYEASSCAACPQNSITLTTGSTAVSACLCDKGHFGAITSPSSKCTECKANTYSDEAGAAACRQCPLHSETVAPKLTGATSASDCQCSAGFEGAILAGQPLGCDPCVKGTYKVATGSAKCVACTAHATTPQNGATGPELCQCDAGYSGMLTKAGDSCTACAVGTFLGALNAPLCMKCPASSTTLAVASTAVTDCMCLPGFTGPITTLTSKCTVCAAGSWKASNGPAACTACTDHATTLKDTSVKLTDCQCSPGYSGNIRKDTDRCTSCVVGTYKVAAGVTPCSKCPDQSTTAVFSKGCGGGQGGSDDACTLASDCVCKPGHSGIITAPTSKCNACAVGQYKDRTDAQAACDKCPADSNTAATGATDADQCLCNPGHAGIILKGTDTCLECQPGQYDDGKTVSATCTQCPAHSTTIASKSTTAADCQCQIGYSGTIKLPANSCTACALGQYADTTASATCKTCPALSTTVAEAATAVTLCKCVPGAFGMISKPSDQCNSCQQGQYQPQVGSTKCNSCPDGATTIGCDNGDGTGCTQASDCLCTAGYFGAGSPLTSCTACPLGQYSDEDGQDQCKFCPTDASTAAAGTDSIAGCICNPGHAGLISKGTDACTACAIGQYLGESAATCTKCTDSATTASTASTKVTDCSCDKGYSGLLLTAADKCTVCPIGTYLSTSAAACTQCTKDATTSQQGSTAVTDCECTKGTSTGKGSIKTPSDTCNQCPAGQYADGNGQDTCTKCPDNSATADPGSSEITACQCNAGFFGTITKSDSKCTSCEVGQYSDTVGSSSCTACPASSTTVSIESKSASQCLCVAGYTGTIGKKGDSCTACAKGKYKGGDPGPATCTECPAQSSTSSVGCLGKDGTGCTAQSDCECAPGYFGEMPTCTTCAIGQYKADAGPQSCDACPSDSTNANVGSIVVTDCSCKPGFSGIIKTPSDTCNQCPAGQYADGNGQDTCTKCPDNSATADPGSSEITDCQCNTGYSGIINKVGDQCSICGADTYKGMVGSADCTPCPDNSNTGSATGCTKTSDCSCSPGYAGIILEMYDQCTACPKDTFLDTPASNCKMCPASSSTADVASKAPTDCLCNAGYSGTISSDTSVCTACGQGQYNDQVGSASCTSCPANTVTRNDEACDKVTDCLCDSGFTGDITDASKTCTACDQGKYKDVSGKDVCHHCPLHSTTSGTGAKSIESCQCTTGYEPSQPAGQCCQVGRENPDGTCKDGGQHPGQSPLDDLVNDIKFDYSQCVVKRKDHDSGLSSNKGCLILYGTTSAGILALCSMGVFCAAYGRRAERRRRLEGLLQGAESDDAAPTAPAVSVVTHSTGDLEIDLIDEIPNPSASV